MLSSSHFVSNVRERALGVIFQGIAVYQPDLDDRDRATSQEISTEGEELPEPISSSPEHPAPGDRYPIWLD